MSLLSVLRIVVFTIGALSFGSLSLLWLQDWKRRRDADPSPEGLSCSLGWKRQADTPPAIHGAMAVFATFWFVAHLAGALLLSYPDAPPSYLRVFLWQISFVWPPLILHAQWAESKAHLSNPRLWKGLLVGCYAVSGPLSLLPGMAAAGWVPFSSIVWWVTPSLIGLFLAVGGCSIYLGLKRPHHQETSEQRSMRVWHLMLWGLVILVMGSILFPRSLGLGNLTNLIGPSFPLIFVFVSVYYLERFTFFDVFVRRGAFAVSVLFLLAGYFALATNILGRYEFGEATPWIYALSLLPFALAFPWLYGRLGRWLDVRWLGRRYSPIEAVKHFLSGVQEATTDEQLGLRAAEKLSDIFQADTQVLFANESAPGEGPGMAMIEQFPTAVVRVPIRLGRRVAGWILMDLRRNKMPFFSRDLDLLTTLAEVLSYSLENARLQQRKQEQEKRERELSIHASRSELKALRAQINPHFLFNALNAIAGLIYRDPRRAEETVEQLAEIFRYTLRGSEKEWARLGDEIEFVRAYLEVEQARFGNRLETTIEIEESAADVQIPTMMIQTLVENSIKHGVASVRGLGVIVVRARRSPDRVRVEVLDNGPGFPAAGERRDSRKGAGYGLKNIRERLQGYFEGQAELIVGRDAVRDMTIVSIEIPASVVSFRRRSGTQ